jgi:pantoate--beta-alanine ligase
MYGSNHVTYVEPTVSLCSGLLFCLRSIRIISGQNSSSHTPHILQGFDDIAEGVSRPGHFKGVATIVTKLFNIVSPTNAYFGAKDAAQCCLIRRIVHDLNMDVNVIVMDTVREADGLAMSSRNAYLTPQERKVAPVVFRSLCTARDLYHEAESISAQQLQDAVQSVLLSEPLVSEVQYVSIDCRETMQPLQVVGKEGAIVSLACKIGSVRLIDNMILKPV